MAADPTNPSAESIFRSTVVFYPRDDTWVTLTEAMTWIAFSASVTADRLLLAFEFSDARLVAPARQRLVDAAERLVYHASRGAIGMAGWPTFDGHLADRFSHAPDIAPRALREFARYDPYHDALTFGKGLAWRHSEEGLDTALIDRPRRAFQNVEVNRAELLAFFPNGHRRAALPSMKRTKPRGRPKGAGSLDRADKLLLDKMGILLASGEAGSPNDAARLVADEAAGYGSLESKQRRLLRKFLKRQ